MLTSDIDDGFECLACVDRAGRIVRVDDDNRLRTIRHLRANVIDIRSPVILLIACVVDGLTAGEGGCCRPERVIRSGNEHLIALVEQRLRGDGNQLGDTVAQPDVVDVETGKTRVHLIARDDGTACGVNTLGLGVALCVGAGPDHVLHDGVRRIKAELCRIAGVEHHNAVAVGFHLLGESSHRTANVIEDVLQLGGLVQCLQRSAARCPDVSTAGGNSGGTGLLGLSGLCSLSVLRCLVGGFGALGSVFTGTHLSKHATFLLPHHAFHIVGAD